MVAMILILMIWMIVTTVTILMMAKNNGIMFWKLDAETAGVSTAAGTGIAKLFVGKTVGDVSHGQFMSGCVLKFVPGGKNFSNGIMGILSNVAYVRATLKLQTRHVCILIDGCSFSNDGSGHLSGAHWIE